MKNCYYQQRPRWKTCLQVTETTTVRHEERRHSIATTQIYNAKRKHAVDWTWTYTENGYKISHCRSKWRANSRIVRVIV